MLTMPAGQPSSGKSAYAPTEQPLDQLVLIETAGGNTIYNAEDPVLTLLGTTPDRRPVYTFQKAGNLKPGQQVPFDKQYINASLVQIAEALSTMPEYAAAQADAFLINSEGKLVPRFKHNLIYGLWQLANKGKAEAQKLPFMVGMSEAELKERILGERGNGFSGRENNAMARYVHGYISVYTADGLRKEDGSPIVSESAVREWVTGETYAPHERNVFYALFDVNPEFEK